MIRLRPTPAPRPASVPSIAGPGPRPTHGRLPATGASPPFSLTWRLQPAQPRRPRLGVCGALGAAGTLPSTLGGGRDLPATPPQFRACACGVTSHLSGPGSPGPSGILRPQARQGLSCALATPPRSPHILGVAPPPPSPPRATPPIPPPLHTLLGSLHLAVPKFTQRTKKWVERWAGPSSPAGWESRERAPGGGAGGVRKAQNPDPGEQLVLCARQIKDTIKEREIFYF